jgi:hypothetical protein
MKNLSTEVFSFAILVTSIVAILTVAPIAGAWCFYLVDVEQTWIRCVLSMAMGFSASVLLSQLLAMIFYRNDPRSAMTVGCVNLFFFGTIGIISSGITVLTLSH